ncbi:response regulator [Parabacteroides sp. AD58]|uniref:histidine kinase n=1 Tax=Parabacteroides absconsus TaxID=2951805 RepID=A0ABZ2IMH2_9BACT|nr:response regulator [Parabacteroides sp. AD58]MCM6903651.1 response regulator [Parabacteroides sp. AD58]
MYGQVATYGQLGKVYRENASFDDAIQYHKKGLEMATQMNDTLEIVKALNNLGTNYRRIGILTEASEYHFRALGLIEKMKGRTYDIKKNRLVAMNGIGNIYLSLGNNNAAERVFRNSLAGEKELNSALGQAINTANLGFIFESREEYDSAYIYFKQSLSYNQQAKSDLGISLCYNHFGNLHEKKGELDEALANYHKAYDIMKGKSDHWHWLESCISMARVLLKLNNPALAQTYLSQARKTARDINSFEHLSAIHKLDYIYFLGQNDCQRALESYIQSQAYADSVKNEESINHLQNLRIKYEIEKNAQEIDLVKKNFIEEQRNKRIILTVSILILLMTCSAIAFLWYALRMRSKTNRTLRQVEQIRTGFFTNITHEFRTPLTVILGLVEQMRNNDVSKDETERYLNSIQRQGNNLLELVNQLLDMSKLMAKADRKQWYRGNIVAFIRMTLDSYREYACSQYINLLFIPESNTIEMDFIPEYFNKIMRNLLSNALKYTPANGIIRIEMKKDKSLLRLQVFNTGNEIPEEEIPRLFDTFYQGSNNEKQIGTGIGLPYTRQMVESMNGNIKVYNKKGEGVVFSVYIPLDQDSIERLPWSDATNVTEQIRGKNDLEKIQVKNNVAENSLSPSILIVEDNLDISFYISTLLKGKYHLNYASDGKEGIDKAKNYMPDLILTDLMMPGMDGYMLCHEIRQSEILNHIPIIIITAKSSDADRIRGLEEGADAYLIKPFNAEELLVRVEKLLEQRRQLRDKFSKALQEGSAQNVELSSRDRDFLNRLTSIIHSHLADKDLNADFIADKMCMSRTQLNRKIRSIADYTATTYILQIRMEKAKRLLASTEQAIGDIATTCGFEDTSYFTRVFKQMFNVTPSQYRKTPKL